MRIGNYYSDHSYELDIQAVLNQDLGVQFLKEFVDNSITIYEGEIDSERYAHFHNKVSPRCNVVFFTASGPLHIFGDFITVPREIGPGQFKDWLRDIAVQSGINVSDVYDL